MSEFTKDYVGDRMRGLVFAGFDVMGWPESLPGRIDHASVAAAHFAGLKVLAQITVGGGQGVVQVLSGLPSQVVRQAIRAAIRAMVIPETASTRIYIDIGPSYSEVLTPAEAIRKYNAGPFLDDPDHEGLNLEFKLWEFKPNPMAHNPRISGAEKFVFVTDCRSSDAESIGSMCSGARDVTRQTFAQHCVLGNLPKNLGYSRDFPMAKDWHVSYHKSCYRGVPCFYFQWSGIEFIFVRPGDLERALSGPSTGGCGICR